MKHTKNRPSLAIAASVLLFAPSNALPTPAQSQHRVVPVMYSEFPGAASLVLTGAEKSPVHLQTDHPRVTGRLTYSTTGKRITIHWLHEVQGLVDGLIPRDRSLATSLQDLTLDFWPTEVIAAGPLRIVVAGLTAQGSNVLQIITLEAEARLPRAAKDPATGVTLLPDFAVGIASKDTHRWPVSSTPHCVAHMWNNRGAADRVFVLYDDSLEIAEVNLMTGAIVKSVAVGPSHLNPAPGAMVLPGLDHNSHVYLAASGGDHVTEGYVYWLHSPNSNHKSVLVLVDADRDGTIDSSSLAESLPVAYRNHSDYVAKR